MACPFDFTELATRSWVKSALAALAIASLVGCDVKGDAGAPDATAPECPGCPDDPYRLAMANCSLQNGVDTLPVETFDNHTLSSGVASAQDLYTYTDGTSPLFVEDYSHVAGRLGVTCAGGISGFEPLVASVTPCEPPGDGGFFPGAFHVFGGTFRGWGGGVGVSMAKLNGRDPITGNTDQSQSFDPRAPKSFCCVSHDAAGQCVATADPKFAAVCPAADAEFAVWMAALDVSQYEGVSFWARRGPNSQKGIRVLVGDKYTDDDLNYLAQRQQGATGQVQPLYCRRVRECDCRIGQTCTFYDESVLPTCPTPEHGGFFCSLPIMGPSMVSTSPDCSGLSIYGGGTPISGAGPSNCCNTTACDDKYAAYPNDPIPDAGRFALAGGGAGTVGHDIQFFGRPCTPYAWTNGIGGSWCFDPATDPPPAPSSELCGDHWTRTVDLSTQWQFYTVPFTQMLQQGWAKKSEHLDLHSVSTLRFSWDVGNIDYWIDEVSFYRRK
jgi:hypothetical protein